MNERVNDESERLSQCVSGVDRGARGGGGGAPPVQKINSRLPILFF